MQRPSKHHPLLSRLNAPGLNKALIATLTALLALTMSVTGSAATERYLIDTKGAHAFIQFKVQHLGYSWLMGRFNRFEGDFKFDSEHPANSSVNVTIDVASIDSNHAERDKHLRGIDFFDVERFPTATFKSKSIEQTGEISGIITGMLTIKGVSKLVRLHANHIGGGDDPWGGYRQGFEATTQIKLKDFGIMYDLGPASQVAEIYISLEGIQQ